MMRRRSAAVVVALVLLGLPIVTATAQGPRRPGAPMQAAVRALLDGRYEEIDVITEKLDQQDPDVAALRGRARIARGQYDEAEVLLKTAANRAPSSEAALQLGLLEQKLGRAEAPGVLRRVASLADSSNDPVEVARGAKALQALGQVFEANRAYQLATARTPNDPAINTGWGELFLQTEQNDEALKSFRDALKADPKWTPAVMGSALALADDDPPQAAAAAKQALAINPNLVEAYVFLARQAADDHRAEARQLLNKALAINPSSIEAHTELAAMAYVEDRRTEFDSEVAKVLAISPNHGEVFRAAGEATARKYRFDEAVELVRRGLALDPDNPQALSDLGVHLLRTGDEPAARRALDRSFQLFPFSRPTKNLLDMMDKLDKFETFQDGDLIFRMSKEDVPVLRDYIVPLAHKALATFAAEFEFQPKGPILIEMFDVHDDFAVRNVGLPGMVGALGACFGRVVTLDSPKARTPGPFFWESTLWHELAHVITIQMSNSRVPRWLTEGISVYEEKKGKPEWARRQDIEFAQLMNQNETIKLKDLNDAFTNPELISIGYYEASLLVEHMMNRFGDAGMQKLLRAYGQGLDTDGALRAALGTDIESLQASFSAELEKNFASLQRAFQAGPRDEELGMMTLADLKTYAAEHPNSYRTQMALGRAYRTAGQLDDAVGAFERAVMLVPIAEGLNSPHGQIAAIALGRNDRTRAIAELKALVDVDTENIEAARQLAGVMKDARVTDPAALRPVYERISAIDPFDIEAHTMLGRLANARNDPETAAREFRAVLALGPVDLAAAHTDLAESYLKGGKKAEAKKETLAALEIAPSYERAQALLLSLVN